MKARRGTRAKKNWSDLTPGQRAGTIITGVVQLVLASAAWTDLARRPRAQVKGPKGLWAVVIAVNWVGPIAYFVFGRRRGVAS
jgi:Phospholipase_D-nuclease N-terminal